MTLGFVQQPGLAANLVIVLVAGLLSGILCRRWNFPTVVGYILAGAFIGPHVLGLVRETAIGVAGAEGLLPAAGSGWQLEDVAQMGALLLLFSLGIEISLEGLWELRREFFIGGLVQTLLAAIPATLASYLGGASWGAALVIGIAVANSSTVMVFKALEEWGQVGTPLGRRTLAILLFGDIVLVPVLLFVPFLTESGAPPGWRTLVILGVQAALLVIAVPLARQIVGHIALEHLSRLRSLELMVLFSVVIFGTACVAAESVGLPAAIGALAAGLIFGGGRWSRQIDAVTLPFRETAAAVFFVGLGTVMRPGVVLEWPLELLVALVAIIGTKALAGAAAARATGLGLRSSLAVGASMGQMSELSFLLLFSATRVGVLSQPTYEFLLLVAVLTLVLTPNLVSWGFSFFGAPTHTDSARQMGLVTAGTIPQAVVIGAGPIGRRIAAQLETMGMDVCLVDLSPVNLYAFAQQGFRTIAGDGQEPEVLYHAGVPHASLVVVTVPDDAVALQIVRVVRHLARNVPILVRCRYQASIPLFKRAGVTAVVAEEVEASLALLKHLAELGPPATNPR
jgi:CPA2 family monovalent cation:H+ antiporter-2